jgi:formate hydrogenlyase subunit 3/multisubunit Na+/H+ antiporter MnhD subunit
VVYPGSCVLFTASLFILLIVYLKEEAKQTENLIYTLFIVNVLMSIFLLTFGWNYTEVSTFNILNVPTNFFDISSWVLFIVAIALFLKHATYLNH